MNNKVEVKPERMAKEERIEATMKLPMLSESLYDLLERDGFKTGSDIYSNVEPNDYDWCINVPPHAFSGFALNTDADYWINDGFASVYAHYHGNLLNIICFSDYELMQAWFMATKVMRRLSNQYQVDQYGRVVADIGALFNEKWARVRVFRALKDIFWPMRELPEPLDRQEALQHHMCMICGREAVNFTCKAARVAYQESGICERCSTTNS
jgi:hypothetical protein